MKNNKGITLTSLVIYIAVIFFILAAIMRVTTYFMNNMIESAEVEFETEFEKINMYLLYDAKNTNNKIEEVQNSKIVFSNGNSYTYNQENKTIYLNDNIKICENIEACLFEQKVADNGKNIISFTVTINGTTRTTEYVMPNQANEQIVNEKEYTWEIIGEDNIDIVTQ